MYIDHTETTTAEGSKLPRTKKLCVLAAPFRLKRSICPGQTRWMLMFYANILRIVAILTHDPRRESNAGCSCLTSGIGCAVQPRSVPHTLEE